MNFIYTWILEQENNLRSNQHQPFHEKETFLMLMNGCFLFCLRFYFIFSKLKDVGNYLCEMELVDELVYGWIGTIFLWKQNLAYSKMLVRCLIKVNRLYEHRNRANMRDDPEVLQNHLYLRCGTISISISFQIYNFEELWNQLNTV